jgi:hypothetical protein
MHQKVEFSHEGVLRDAEIVIHHQKFVTGRCLGRNRRCGIFSRLA